MDDYIKTLFLKVSDLDTDYSQNIIEDKMFEGYRLAAVSNAGTTRGTVRLTFLKEECFVAYPSTTLDTGTPKLSLKEHIERLEQRKKEMNT
jgi:hypothetical protein